MLEIQRRPFTDTERERVEQDLLTMVTDLSPSHPEALGVGLLCAFFGLFIGAVIAAFLALLELSFVWARIVIGFGIVTGFILGWRDQKRTEQRLLEFRKARAAVLAKRLQWGEMEEITVVASGVVAADFNEEEGTDYFFDIGENRVLFLRGYMLCEDEEGDSEEDDPPSIPSAFRFCRYPDTPDTIASFTRLGTDLLTPLYSVTLETEDDVEETYKEVAIFENVALATLAIDLPFVTDAKDAKDQ